MMLYVDFGSTEERCEGVVHRILQKKMKTQDTKRRSRHVFKKTKQQEVSRSRKTGRVSQKAVPQGPISLLKVTFQECS